MAELPRFAALAPPPQGNRWLMTVKDTIDRLWSLNRQGYGSPENVVTADKGATYRRLDGGAGTCFYVHEGADNTKVGWVAK